MVRRRCTKGMVALLKLYEAGVNTLSIHFHKKIENGFKSNRARTSSVNQLRPSKKKIPGLVNKHLSILSLEFNRSVVNIDKSNEEYTLPKIITTKCLSYFKQNKSCLVFRFKKYFYLLNALYLMNSARGPPDYGSN